MHLEIYKLAISFREEFMASKNLIGEKFMIPCKNIHPWSSVVTHNQSMELITWKKSCSDNLLSFRSRGQNTLSTLCNHFLYWASIRMHFSAIIKKSIGAHLWNFPMSFFLVSLLFNYTDDPKIYF